MSLTDEGWERRNIVDAFRVDEQVLMYEELGYEVIVRNLDVKEMSDEECNTCFLENPEAFKVIYTRRKNDDLSDLF